MAEGEIIQRTMNEVLNDYGERVVAALKDNLEFRKKLASRRLSDSIKFKIVSLVDTTTFELSLADYYKFVDKGRGPTKSGGGPIKGPLDWGKPSLRKNILQWMTYKGIQPSAQMGYGKNKAAGKVSTATALDKAREMAYLISRKIHREGYKGSNFFTDVFKSGGVGDVKQLEQELSAAMGRAIRVELQIV